MFKSSEKLRHEAAQRQLDRVASSWRNARTTWFDGTPEAIEARLAETNRILAVARSGYSPAHLGLTVEAENARRELLAAKHRLLTDFLDDGARAFQGSRREAGPSRCQECGKTLRDSTDRLNHAHGPDGEVYDGGPQYGFESHDDFYNRTFGAGRTAGWEEDLDKTPGLRQLSEGLGQKLLSEPAEYARSYHNEDGEPGLPGGWPKELRQHLNDPYSAGYAASGHSGYLNHEDPWSAAGSDFHNAGGRGGDSFDDGWIDYASDIPHRYNDPEGYAAYHAEMG